MKTLDLSKSVYELSQGVPVWMDKGGRTMLVTYLAVRDADRTYLGTVELVQDIFQYLYRIMGGFLLAQSTPRWPSRPL